MKTRLALGLLTIATSLITSVTALAQQSDSGEAVKAESAESGTGHPYTAYSGLLTEHRASEPPAAPDPVQPVAAGSTKEAGKVKVEARTARRVDPLSSDNGPYDYYKDLAPFGE